MPDKLRADPDLPDDKETLRQPERVLRKDPGQLPGEKVRDLLLAVAKLSARWGKCSCERFPGSASLRA